jgi:hypothetical protein
MEKRGENRDDIPAGKGKNAGGRLEPFRGDIVNGMHRGTLAENRRFARAKTARLWVRKSAGSQRPRLGRGELHDRILHANRRLFHLSEMRR